MKKREGYSVLNNLNYLLGGIWKSDKRLMLLMFVEAVCTVITPYAAIYLPKIGVDLVSYKAGVGETMLLIGGLGAVMALSQMLGNMAARGKSMLLNRLRSYYRRLLFCKTLDCDYEHVESAQWQDQYEQARLMSVNWGPWSATTLMSEGVIKVCGAIVSFCLYSSILAAINPWLLLFLIILSVFHFATLRRAQKHEVSRLAERSGIQRRLSYMTEQAQDLRLGKDIRLYEMAGWIRMHYHHYRVAHYLLRKDVQNHYWHAGFVEAVTLFFRDGAAYLYFLYEATSGRMTPGDFVLACNAVASFSALVTLVSDSVGQMMQAVPPLNRMRAYLESADEPEPDSAAAVPPEGEPVAIEFRDVCFTYQGKNKVLDHFSLSIQPGEKIALVGVNGAGKTTLVKLLCGFYKPDSGRILVGGNDVSSYRKEDLYSLISPVFQEATILPFTVAENVSMRVEGETDKRRVRDCLKQVGLWEAVERMPLQEDSMMMNLEKKGGNGLSGGQQQKLLMARALYKDARLMFFDEPTAALDPIAERETYELFHTLSGEKTSVYISHRLASTRFCDRVIFLEKGRVKAEGTHDELLHICPDYARMYEVQSQYYKKGETGMNWELAGKEGVGI